MKDWKTWAILLLTAITLFQYSKLRNLENLYRDGMQACRQEINRVGADALDTRLNASKVFMLQMNCALVESSLKQWNACVVDQMDSIQKSDSGKHN
jgi:hypothetical protein